MLRHPAWVSATSELCICLLWVSPFCLDFSTDPAREQKADLEEEGEGSNSTRGWGLRTCYFFDCVTAQPQDLVGEPSVNCGPSHSRHYTPTFQTYHSLDLQGNPWSNLHLLNSIWPKSPILELFRDTPALSPCPIPSRMPRVSRLCRAGVPQQSAHQGDAKLASGVGPTSSR